MQCPICHGKCVQIEANGDHYWKCVSCNQRFRLRNARRDPPDLSVLDRHHFAPPNKEWQ